MLPERVVKSPWAVVPREFARDEQLIHMPVEAQDGCALKHDNSAQNQTKNALSTHSRRITSHEVHTIKRYDAL